ncbi:MAG: hypothetical protein SFZ23_01575 [Planctomycetota bacterium]|nr:hypothetical protein [Planctomycetota bacterium]
MPSVALSLACALASGGSEKLLSTLWGALVLGVVVWPALVALYLANLHEPPGSRRAAANRWYRIGVLAAVAAMFAIIPVVGILVMMLR